MLVSGVGGPLLAGTGALVGFFLGGPALALTLAMAGGALPAVLFGGYDVVVGTGDILAGREGGKRQLLFGLGLLAAGPGVVWAGAAVGGLAGTVTAATLGAMLAPGLLLAGIWLAAEIGRRRHRQE